jgi:hypothetical protein
MPEPDGSLNAQERERFDEWVAAHWSNPDCPVCHSKQWTRGGKLHQVINEATLMPDGTSIPAVSLACEVCGYTMLVNAITAGVVHPERLLRNEEPVPQEREE